MECIKIYTKSNYNVNLVYIPYNYSIFISVTNQNMYLKRQFSVISLFIIHSLNELSTKLKKTTNRCCHAFMIILYGPNNGFKLCCAQ